MKGMNYQDYIWDLGGTLLDNYETSTAAFVQTLKEFGLQAGHDEVYKALKVSTDYAIQQFAPQEKDFLKFYKANEAEELTHPVLFDGAAELLRRIVAKGDVYKRQEWRLPQGLWCSDFYEKCREGYFFQQARAV